MKRMMIAVACMAGTLLAVPADKLELIGATELAPFGEISRANENFGKMIGNPLLSTMMLSGVQQNMAQTYGQCRADAPTFWLFYADIKAYDVALAQKDPSGVKDPWAAVIVYPLADGEAQMLLKHTGSKKEADGTIHLLPGKRRCDDMWLKYTADGAFCAFAQSPDVAIRAARDCEQMIAARKARNAKGRTPLALVHLNERGIALIGKTLALVEIAQGAEADKDGDAIAKVVAQYQTIRNRRQLAMLNGYRKAEVAFDLDDTGIVIDARAVAKAGAKPMPGAGFKLPMGAFDVAKAESPFFGAGCAGLQPSSPDAAEKQLICSAINQLVAKFATELKQGDGKKYAQLIDEVSAAMQELLLAMPVAEATDWSAAALAFDAEQHPCMFMRTESKQAAAMLAASTKCYDRICAACTRQWPNQKFFVKKTPTAWTFDIAAIFEMFHGGKDITPEDRLELAHFRSGCAKVLGSTKLDISFSQDGRMGFIGSPAVKPGKPMAGEAKLAAALPEIAKARPAGAFCMTPYAFVRENLLPIVCKFADKKDLGSLQSMRAAMPAPTKRGAIAAAVWIEPNGSSRALLRVTADEIRNLGAAFNAFTAAQMGAATEDDE